MAAAVIDLSAEGDGFASQVRLRSGSASGLPSPHVDRVLQVARSRVASRHKNLSEQGLVRRLSLLGRAASDADSYFGRRAELSLSPVAAPPRTDFGAVCPAAAVAAAVAACAAAAEVPPAIPAAALAELQRLRAELEQSRQEAEQRRRDAERLRAVAVAAEERQGELSERLCELERRNCELAAAAEGTEKAAHMRQLFADCYITEFVEIPPAPRPDSPQDEVVEEIRIPAPEPSAPPDTPSEGGARNCTGCDALRERIDELDTELDRWRVREAEFADKEQECRRLRTILRFSQLKKDSDRLHEVEHRVLDLELEMDRRAFQSRILISQRAELQRLREVEREYMLVRQMWAEGAEPEEALERTQRALSESSASAPQRAPKNGGASAAGGPSSRGANNGGAEPPRGAAAAAAGPPSPRSPPGSPRGGDTPGLHCNGGAAGDIAAAAGVQDKDVTFSTICDRMKTWLRSKEAAPAPAAAPRQPVLQRRPSSGGTARSLQSHTQCGAETRVWSGGQWVGSDSTQGQQRPLPQRRQRVSSAPPGGRRKQQPPPPAVQQRLPGGSSTPRDAAQPGRLRDVSAWW
eukprot:TRINITY_DN6206_c0_g1_i1.p1 TRINITY_DN6206_c0_g1~~TRINITY_DN6206_c0_g1_i1.p1  ORF type:complete len:622 (+),score=153.05 TRINITY_DN6206_c0_g1_i1:133-1866(+)